LHYATFRHGLTIAAWGYLVVVLAVWAMLWLAGDRWWPATLLTFGPRWMALLPLPVLALPGLFFDRRLLAPVVLAATLAAGPVMGFCISWTSLAGATPVENAALLRVMTYNAGEGGTDVKLVGDFVERERPDVLIVNEWPAAVTDLRGGLGAGWHSADHQSTAVFSRYPIKSIKKLGPDQFRKPWRAPALRCELATPSGTIYVVGLHLDTPREGLEAIRGSLSRVGAEMEQMTTDRHSESEMASQLAAESSGPAVVAGDFNMPIDSALYQRYWSSWQNAFSIAGLGYGQTKFTRFFGVRIDHVLASRDWQVLAARVGPNLGGDHRPVLVDLQRRVD
jgi:endonuclease/exonuclease/phosphatase (EEP) superfamily protein YafD